MRVRAAKTLVTFPQGPHVTIYNYLTKDAVTCASPDIHWLLAADEWMTAEEFSAQQTQYDPQSVTDQIMQLVACGIYVAEGSRLAAQEENYLKCWELGPAAGLFHFSVLDNIHGDQETGVAQQNARAVTDPSPPLFWRHGDDAVVLQRPSCDDVSVLSVMARRRTRREVTDEAISIEDMSRALYAGLGLTGFIDGQAGILPLKMTPSGGARNPYEAFVWAQNVEGLQSGLYHYAAADHSLMPVAPAPDFPKSKMVHNQDWADLMPAMILLVAILERTTWKYHDPNAYRVVLIEAGHIAQNIMLACTERGLTACPTAALCHSVISSAFGLKQLTHFPVYALTLGHPAPSADITYSVEEGLARQGQCPRKF